MATLDQTNKIIEILRTLLKGASTGLFGNAVFFNQQPDTAKPFDISLNTISGIITQYDGEFWSQVANLASQIELNNHLNDNTDAHNASAISNNPLGNLLATNVQSALNELQGDVNDLNALKGDKSELDRLKWIDLITTWTAEPTTISYSGADGEVLQYTYGGTIYYRFIPSPYVSDFDAFYENYSDPNLTNLIATRGVSI